MHVIIDTNVPIVANNRTSPQASPACILACVRKLRQIRAGHIVVLDDAWHILREYQNNLNPTGQGVGDISYLLKITKHHTKAQNEISSHIPNQCTHPNCSRFSCSNDING